MRSIVYIGIFIVSILSLWIFTEAIDNVPNNPEIAFSAAPQVNATTTNDSLLTSVAPKSAEPLPKQKTKKFNNTINLDTLFWIAKKYIGTPYKMGGTTFKGMDCSGLLVTIFKEMGYKLPHNSAELSKNGILIPSISQLTEGDLLFFHTEWENKGLINHTGLYLGKGYFIHASTSQGTIISKITNPSYKNSFICATRILLPQPSIQLSNRSRMMIVKVQ